jgi:hypothetical protein
MTFNRLAEGEIKIAENKIPDEFDRWKQMQQRQIEMNKIPTPEKTYTTIEGHIWIAEIKTKCPDCGSRGVWTYTREPDLWRCAKCQRIPPAGAFLELIPDENLCPTCKFHFCIRSQGVARIDECERYQRAQISNKYLIELTRGS